MNQILTLILGFTFFLLNSCSPKEEIIQPKAIVLSVIGDVTASGKKLNLAQEITNEEIIVGKASLCDLQLLESETLVVIRLKAFSKFKLTGKNIGNTKQNFFNISYGNAIFNASKTVPKDEIKTLTPTLTAGVRGTKYEVEIQPNGSTKLYVLEGEISTKPRIPEIDAFSNSEIKDNKILKTISKNLDKREFTVKAGKSFEISSEIKKKLFHETGLSKSIKKSNPKEIGQDIDVDKIEEKISEMEKNEFQFSVKEIDPKNQERKLKEYEEIVPFEKDKINNKEIRNKIIQARFQKIEKDWWTQFKEWLQNLK